MQVIGDALLLLARRIEHLALQQHAFGEVMSDTQNHVDLAAGPVHEGRVESVQPAILTVDIPHMPALFGRFAAQQRAPVFDVAFVIFGKTEPAQASELVVGLDIDAKRLFQAIAGPAYGGQAVRRWA